MENPDSLSRQADKEFNELINSYSIEEKEERVKKIYEACYKQYLDALTESLSLQYDKAASYFNIIFAAGYAGLFTAWGNLKDDLTKQQNFIICFSLVISIGVFMLWEVIKMISTYRQIKKSQKILDQSKESIVDRTKTHTNDVKKQKLKLEKYGLPIIWFVTISSGAVAAITLIYGLFKGLS